MFNHLNYETMKTVFLKNWLAFGLMALAAFGFAACSDDDGTTPPPPGADETVVEGSYAGTMSVVEAAVPAEGEDADEPAGTAVEAAVSAEAVGFTDFPIRDLVVRIVGEDSADAIVEAVGKVDYSIPYTAEMSEDKSAVAMTLSPETLVISMPIEGAEPLEIGVAVSAEADAVYTVENGKLVFNLSVEGITVGGEALEGFEAFSLDFDLAKNTTEE